eukprot:TRINITY_DN550_c0_g1_i2.p1 TRINITY_DN550_c0_g1~~TRINITY_DN550_c0_g1_i2.p1  ORF type:complete len:300 (+),score=46.96 TRINITY_DN550_c0_g1_i2:1060-1959(+)
MATQEEGILDYQLSTSNLIERTLSSGNINQLSKILASDSDVPYSEDEFSLTDQENREEYSRFTDAAYVKLRNFIHNLELKLIRDAEGAANQVKEEFVTESEVSAVIAEYLGLNCSDLGSFNYTISHYFHVIDRATILFNTLVSGDETDGWIPRRNKHGVQCYIRQEDDPTTKDMLCTRGVGEVPFPPRTIYEFINDENHMGCWDPLMNYSKKIEEIDRNTAIYHLKFSATVCILKQCRDFVILRHGIQNRDGSYIQLATSIPYDSISMDDNYIRGEIKIAGFLITPSVSIQFKWSINYR